jgi:hypothetical protein
LQEKLGGQSAPAGPQPVGGGTQLMPKQHWPFMHTPGAGHSPPLPQPIAFGTHWLFWQVEPGGQGAPLAQSTATQVPLSQVDPAGHSTQPLEMQTPFWHVEPGGHIVPLSQVMGTLPSSPPGVVQVPSLPQVDPDGQSADVVQGVAKPVRPQPEPNSDSSASGARR